MELKNLILLYLCILIGCRNEDKGAGLQGAINETMAMAVIKYFEPDIIDVITNINVPATKSFNVSKLAQVTSFLAVPAAVEQVPLKISARRLKFSAIVDKLYILYQVVPSV